MPIYEYRCRRCDRLTSKLFKTMASVKLPPCSHCGSRRLERIISRVAIFRSGGASSETGPDGDFAGMDDVMTDLESGDPRGLARMARRMSDEMGEEMPGEYEGLLRRMEAGEMPSDEEFETVEPESDDGDVDDG